MVQLLTGLLLLGVFSWWTIQAVSLPPVLRDLFEEDDAIAWAARPPAEEDPEQAELVKLPTPSEQHAPEVATLLASLREFAPDDGEEDLKNFLEAWEVFAQGPPIPWQSYPDSARLLRGNFLKLLRPPHTENDPGEVFFLPNPRLVRKLQGLGTLRFESGSWAMTDTVAVSEMFCEATTSFEGSTADLRSLRDSFPPSPSVQHLRDGLRTDRAVLTSAALYLENLPARTPARLGLARFLGNLPDADAFLLVFSDPGMSAGTLARQLRQSCDQIADLEQKTFLSSAAWRLWLESNPSQGLGPLLGGSLDGMRGLETAQRRHAVILACLEAGLAYRQEGLAAARRVPDPARAGSFLRVEATPEQVVIRSDGNPDPTVAVEAFSFSLRPASEAP